VLPLILSLLVAAPSPYVAPGVYKAPPRCPVEVLHADLPDWAKIVWFAVRKVQGANETAWAGRQHYAEMTGKAPTQVSTALSLLKAEGYLVELGRRGRDPELRCHVPLTDWRAASSWAPSVNPDDSQGDGSVNAHDSEDPGSVNPHDPRVNPDDRPVNPDDSDTSIEESGQGIRSVNPLPPVVPYSGARKKSEPSPGPKGGRIDPAEDDVSWRPDGGVNGNRLAREVAAEPVTDSPEAREARRSALLAEMPGLRFDVEPASPAPSASRAHLDAEADEAIAALPTSERSRLFARATRQARRQWPGTWPGDRDAAVRLAVARIARELLADDQDCQPAAEVSEVR